MTEPVPPIPIAPVISPELTSEQRRDKYQKSAGDDGEETFVYDPENPKTPPRRRHRRKSQEKPVSDDDMFTNTAKKNDAEAIESGLGYNGSSVTHIFDE